MCVCVCVCVLYKKPQFCYSDENPCHTARFPLKILKGKLYQKGDILTSEFIEFMDFFRRMSKFTHYYILGTGSVPVFRSSSSFKTNVA